MAPTAADPRQILVVCNDPRRQAFYQLVEEITRSMRSEIELDNPQNQLARRQSGNEDDGPSQAGAGIQASFGQSQLNKLQKTSYSRDGLPKQLVALRRDALEHFDDWSKEILKKLREITSTKADAKIYEARQKRREEIAKIKESQSSSKNDEGDLISFGDTENSDTPNARNVPTLQQHYKPVSTRLTTVPVEDRRELLSCMLLIVLATGSYSAHSRTLALHLTSSLELPLAVLITEETEIATYLVEASTAESKDGSVASKNAAAAATMSGEAEAEKRRKENKTSRFWKVGLASVAGAAVIGVTGGLAAPVVAGALGGIMGSVGLGGVASFLGIFWANGALVGTLFGAFGAKMTGKMMDAYAKEVNDFRFIPLREELAVSSDPTTDRNESKDRSDTPTTEQKLARRLRVTVGINGWLADEADVTRPWRVLGAESEVFALRYEMEALIALGTSLDGLVRTYAWKYVKLEILKKTVLASLTAVLWPAYLLSTASNIDNPFHLARNRSEKAGRVLADALINRAQGERPVTLVGYSLGARAIHSCLRALADRRAFGLVDNVVLIGAPAPSDTHHWLALRSVVSGRVFNVFSGNDYILGFLYRATSLQLGIAGLQPIEGVPGVENLDLTDEVAGHLRYPSLIAQVLTRCGFPDVRDDDDGAIEQDEDIAKVKRGDVAEGDDVPEVARAIRADQAGVRGVYEDEEKEEGPPPPLPRRTGDGGSGGSAGVAVPKRDAVQGGEKKAPPPWASSGGDPLGLGSVGKMETKTKGEKDGGGKLGPNKDKDKDSETTKQKSTTTQPEMWPRVGLERTEDNQRPAEVHSTLPSRPKHRDPAPSKIDTDDSDDDGYNGGGIVMMDKE